ncbi:hypothetical protein FHP25_01315 [Vineibacter terrae]|uniref:Uncharacterized protein n=1 Tax=Vineibacter terrae TaxID=2586908 RepID=A0A5C8PW89_9HYPH|nr:hypothetical protein [Vineibacter terrae]TXL82364.1 hypothetical protein FHP25_01315 [Vineibacter terrae]
MIHVKAMPALRSARSIPERVISGQSAARVIVIRAKQRTMRCRHLHQQPDDTQRLHAERPAARLFASRRTATGVDSIALKMRVHHPRAASTRSATDAMAPGEGRADEGVGDALASLRRIVLVRRLSDAPATLNRLHGAGGAILMARSNV